MYGRETLAMEVSRSSMKVAMVTVRAMIQGLITGRDGARAMGADGGGGSVETAAAMVESFA
jgi:hypothetical protein